VTTDTIPQAPSEEFLRLIPRDFARAHLLLSRGRVEGIEHVWVSESTGAAAIWNAAVRLGVPIETEAHGGEEIARLIDEAYGVEREPENGEGTQHQESVEDLLAVANRDLLTTQGKAPVVKLVDALLLEALQRGASDLHIQPMEERTLVRLRVDGALHTVRELSAAITQAVLSRVKVMGRMDIAEKRLAQDGRATVNVGDRGVDLRISTFPTNRGERLVLRLLDPGRQLLDLESLGMPPALCQRYLKAANRADGLVLVTGPTGSGKSTSLYATLKKVASSDLNVMTIEDPIEYDLGAAGLSVSQSQVSARKGVTFASGLRNVLRQDPDVVLVGEIRDGETARMAIQSSLTGHLVFSTLHTNDAASAVTRMIDLGVEPFLLAASLSAVLAQRLVRRRHLACGGQGCEECLASGYLGRMGVFELLVVDEELRRLIARNESLAILRDCARKGGLRTLREEADRLIAEGATDLLEVERVIEAVS
jgi:general secretion pathway protein E